MVPEAEVADLRTKAEVAEMAEAELLDRNAAALAGATGEVAALLRIVAGEFAGGYAASAERAAWAGGAGAGLQRVGSVTPPPPPRFSFGWGGRGAGGLGFFLLLCFLFFRVCVLFV